MSNEISKNSEPNGTKPHVGGSLPLQSYRVTLLTIKKRIENIRDCQSENEKQYHIGLVLKMIREELFLWQ